MKSGLAPNPKNSGISELWNAPSFGVDFPRLNTDKGRWFRMSQIKVKKKNIQNANAGCVSGMFSRRNLRGAWNAMSP
jgi:hypothetical protein